MKDNFDRYNEYEKIIKFTESLKFPVIEINKELFEMHSDFSILFPPDSKYHFSNEGYRYITEKIFDRIKEIEK